MPGLDATAAGDRQEINIYQTKEKQKITIKIRDIIQSTRTW